MNYIRVHANVITAIAPIKIQSTGKNDMGNSSKLNTKKAYKVRLDSSEWTVKSQQ